jgi:hypothetical protein
MAMTVVVVLLAAGLILWSLVWGGRRAKAVVGVLAIIAALLWLPIWFFAAAWVAAPADIRLWAVFCVLLALGILLLLIGISLIRGRLPKRYGWLVWSVAVVVPLGMFVFVFQDDRGEARINSAVSRAYEKRRQVSFVEIYTQCDYEDMNADGSESWACEVEPYHEEVKTCDAVVMRRSFWRISVQLEGCRGDES